MAGVNIKLKDNSISIVGRIYQADGTLTAAANATNANNVDVYDTLRGIFVIKDQPYNLIRDADNNAFGANVTDVVTALSTYFSGDNPDGLAKTSGKLNQFAAVESWTTAKAGQLIIVGGGEDQELVTSTPLNESNVQAAVNKVAGIEAGAEVNPTASEVKTLYESNSNTNAFTDAEQSKLSGIAAGAEVNVNADWNAATGDAQILNKPTIPDELQDLAGTADDITEGQGNLFLTTTERTKLGYIDASGNLDVGNIAYSGLITIENPSLTYAFQGEVSPVTGSGLTAGNLYNLTASGWALADASAEATCSNMLGIAVSATQVMIRGHISNGAYAGFTHGQPLYVKSGAGAVTNLIPTTSGHIVRKVGFSIEATATKSIYFNPSNDYIEVA